MKNKSANAANKLGFDLKDHNIVWRYRLSIDNDSAKGMSSGFGLVTSVPNGIFEDPRRGGFMILL